MINKDKSSKEENEDKSSKEEPISLLNTESSNSRNATPLNLKKVAPESNSNKVNINKKSIVKLGKEAMIKLHCVDDKVHNGKSINAVRYEANDSNDTEIYSMEEKIIGTIWTLGSEKKKPQKGEQKLMSNKLIKTIKTSNRIIFFKCPIKGCNVRKENRKKVNKHYKQKHKRKFKCDKCDKRYIILHSLKQHLYNLHIKNKFICVKCNINFTFLSQFKIHWLTHTQKNQIHV